MSKPKPEEEAKEAGEAPPAAFAILQSEAPSPQAGAGQGWMVTFTDLVALLITFFVMLFAMSQVEERKWHNLTNALSRNLDIVREVSIAIPTDDLDVQTLDTVPATDLDYLSLLLEETIAGEEALAEARLHREEDRLIISLPGERFFVRGGAVLQPDGEQDIATLSGVLRNLTNRIEVTASTERAGLGGGFASSWDLSLARSARVAALLAQAGYERSITLRGLGDSRSAEPLDDIAEAAAQPDGVSRVVIAVHEDAGKLKQ